MPDLRQTFSHLSPKTQVYSKAGSSWMPCAEYIWILIGAGEMYDIGTFTAEE